MSNDGKDLNPSGKQESKSVDPVVFWGTFIITGLFVIWGLLDVESLSAAFDAAMGFLTGELGWVYLFYGTIVLFLVLFFGFSRFGQIKLGKPDDDPEYSTRSWIAMLFSAGMGIGLVFWGVAEPINHYAYPPIAEGETAAAAEQALEFSLFHWGLHPWALYAIFGMMLAYFSFRRGLPQLPSSLLYPLGENVAEGLIGKTFDIFCGFLSLVGIATSLGLGAMQINSGLGELFGLPVTTTAAVTIIVVITIAFIISAITGIDRGIKYLSNANITIGSVLLILMIVLGPTFFIMNYLAAGVGGYLDNIFSMSFFTSPVEQSPWPGWWTIFYWAWWTSWVPWVGGFIGRISKGRTIKEFVMGVLFVPTMASFVWFATMGGSGIYLERFGGGGIVEAVNQDVASAFFVTLTSFPGGVLMAVLATILIATFFTTSADSGTFVLGMLTSRGIKEPSKRTKVVWGTFEGLIAVVLLLAGGLDAVQSAAISASLPFILFIWVVIYVFYKTIKKDYQMSREGEFIGEIK